MTHDVERVLADIDADHGDHCVEFLRHGVLLVLSAPCQLFVLAGPEHGRTIPLADTRSESNALNGDVRSQANPGRCAVDEAPGARRTGCPDRWIALDVTRSAFLNGPDTYEIRRKLCSLAIA